MKRWGHHFYVLLSLLCLTTAQEWDYRENGPLTWGEIYPTCNGNSQSPIALSHRWWMSWPFSFLGSDVDAKLIDYDQMAKTSNFSNTGETVRMLFNYSNLDESARPRTIYTDDTGSFVFWADSLHFHWPCEHTINDEKCDLEMHIVHRDSSGNILVLSYVFEEQESCNDARINSGMNNLASMIRSSLREAGRSVQVEDFAPGQVMPLLRFCRYFVYSGSLTTPPCTEGVIWMVGRESMCVSTTVMDIFRSVKDSSGRPMTGNRRPLQGRNNRDVYYKSCLPFI